MGGEEKSAAECLNQCLQKLLEKYYDKVQGRFRLCMCVRPDKAGSPWQVLSGAGEHPDEITGLLRDETKLESHIAEKLEKKNEYVLCITEVKTVRDSGFLMREPKKVVWVFLGGEYGHSVHILLKILSDELLSGFDDLLFLETLKNKINPSSWDNVEDLKRDRLCRYFLGNILEKEWLTREYVKQALKTENLPDWRTLIHISSMFYEKRTVKTCLYFSFAESACPSWGFKLKFPKGTAELCSENNFDFRRMRKLMELSGSANGLFIRILGQETEDGDKEYEVEGIIEKYEEGKEPPSVVCVEFLEHMVWQLRKGTEVYFQYQKGEYKLPELEFSDDAQKEIDKLKDIGKLNDIDHEELVSLVEKVRTKADHGTTLIFMDDNTFRQETKRLVECHRAIPVESFNLADKVDNVAELFAIDGAVLLDFSCNCQAVGAIVDGKAYLMPEGMSRGARYNSITSYVKGLRNMGEGYAKAVCFAVIFSEDRMVNVVVNTDAAAV